MVSDPIKWVPVVGEKVSGCLENLVIYPRLKENSNQTQSDEQS